MALVYRSLTKDDLRRWALEAYQRDCAALEREQQRHREMVRYWRRQIRKRQRELDRLGQE